MSWKCSVVKPADGSSKELSKEVFNPSGGLSNVKLTEISGAKMLLSTDGQSIAVKKGNDIILNCQKESSSAASPHPQKKSISELV